MGNRDGPEPSTPAASLRLQNAITDVRVRTAAGVGNLLTTLHREPVRDTRHAFDLTRELERS
jgi:hypothetical protein